MSIPERLAESVLSNPRADRVRAVAGLARRSARLRQGLFLAEGPQNVREALTAHVAADAATESSGRPSSTDLPSLDALYVTEGCLERHEDIAGLLRRLLDGEGPHRVFVRVVTEEVLRAMSDTRSPQGALAVCRMPSAGWPWVTGSARLLAVLCRVQDPGNAGTVIRAADAAGADAVLLTEGSVDLYNPKTVRSTAGSLFHLPVIPSVVFSEAVEDAVSAGIQVLAADGYGAADLDALQDAAVREQPAECDLGAPTAWLFGNEAQGLSDREKSAAAHRVAVPLYGAAESLNVGTAATLCLYASARAQRR